MLAKVEEDDVENRNFEENVILLNTFKEEPKPDIKGEEKEALTYKNHLDAIRNFSYYVKN